jgi:23S rRNA (cytosine1962-C5)-methyltransferase
VDDAWWQAHVTQAAQRRAHLAADPQTTCYRLIHAESDRLPGLIVDRYADWLILQSLTLGIERRKTAIVAALAGLEDVRGIYERADVDVRPLEGLDATSRVLWGDPPPNLIEVREHGHAFLVDVWRGHKTGFYLDQRDNRQAAADLVARLSPAGDVLNAFSYTGGFSVYARAAGAAHVVNVDTSAEALELARRNLALNGLDPDRDEYLEADVFQQLRAFRETGRTFNLIVLDPPKFAHSQAQVERAARGYKDINLLAFHLLRPGGLLMTFSCSGVVSADLFQKIVFGASVDAGRPAQIIRWLGQPEDHPVLLSFPEGRYLKGLVCRVT